MNDVVKIGVIGLGNAGSPILNNLHKSNKYKLFAFDIDINKLNDVPESVIKTSSIKNLAFAKIFFFLPRYSVFPPVI